MDPGPARPPKDQETKVSDRQEVLSPADQVVASTEAIEALGKSERFTFTDLQELETEDLATLHVLDPFKELPMYDKDGNPVEIDLYGQDSNIYRQAQRSLLDRRLSKSSRTVTAEEIEHDTVEICVACTKDIRGLNLAGNPIGMDKKSLRALYSNSRLTWLRDQVDNFIRARGNYRRASSTS